MKTQNLAARSSLLLVALTIALGVSNLGHAAHELAPASMAPSDALAELKKGNERFAAGKMSHLHQDAARRDEVAKGQHPHTIVLSCSDSRVPPEVVFDQGLGELFVIRSAGHVIESSEIASIEYAVAHTGAKHIVVMGHESCGAIKATLETPEGTSAGSPHLDKLVGLIRPGLASIKKDENDKTLRAPVEANVNATAKNLRARSQILREAIDKKELVITNAVYSLNTGKVDFWPAGGATH